MHCLRSARGLAWLLLMVCVGARALAEPVIDPWAVPGDVAELQRFCSGRAGLESFANNGHLGIECGNQAALLGSRLPIGPRPHVPWAKPYARGPIKLLIVTTSGFSPADVEELAQVARELHADVRWLLLVDLAVTASDQYDDLYWTRYVPERARAVLREDYDVILLTFGTNTPEHGPPLARAYFPDDVYRSILQKVQRGTGLVLVGQQSGGAYWAQRSPLSAALPAHMTGGFYRLSGAAARLDLAAHAHAFAGLGYEDPSAYRSDKPLIVYDWKLQPDAQVLAYADGHPAIMARDHGQGRVVLLGWDGTLGPLRYGGRLELERGTALGLRALTFAARKEPQLRLEITHPPLRAGEPAPLRVTSSAPARIQLTLRDEAFRVLQSRTLRAAAGANALCLRPMAKGQYFMQVIATDSQGRVLSWGDERVEVQAPYELTIKTDREVYRVGDTVHVSWQQAGLSQASGLTAVLEVRDATGRVLARSARAWPPAQPAAALAYVIEDARVAPHKLTLTLMQQGAPLVRAVARFYVPSSQWDDYENIMWPSRLGAQLNFRMRDQGGFTAVFDGHGDASSASVGAHYGMRAARLNDMLLDPALLQTQPLLAAERSRQTLDRAIDAARRYGALAWLFQDERTLVRDAGPPDAEGLARFRSYLRAHYASLAALNASWGTHYRSFEAVRPTLTSDVPAGTENLAPWVDFRLYVADQAFQLDAERARSVRAALGEATPIGLDGFTSGRHSLPYAALDFGRLVSEGVFNFYAPYADDLLFASLVRGPLVKYVGWAMPRSEYFAAPWRNVLRGHRGSIRFFGPTFWSDFGFMQPAGRWTGEGTRELREGIGKLLIGSERSLSPVVILYSYPGLVTGSAAGLWASRHGGEAIVDVAAESRAVIEQLLLGEGVAVGYQTDAQLARGGLRDKKLLIIPRQMGLALSDATAQAIERFVREGGTVLADLAPGLCDEHGKLRARGALDTLFGVRTSGESIVHAAREYGAAVRSQHALVPEGEWLFDEWYDPGLRVTDGRAAGEHVTDGSPAFVIKQSGRGQALLLNLLLSSVLPTQPAPGPEQRALLRKVLQASGVVPLSRVETVSGVAQTHCEVNRFQDGENTYIGFFAHADPDADPALVRARFSDVKETYDVRAGRYLGNTAQVALPLAAQQAALFARLSYRPTALRLSAPARAARGQSLRVAIELAATAQPGRHVVHVQVLDANHKPRPLYSQNVVLRAGHGELLLMAALNDPPGAWTIRAREVVSGLRAERVVELE